MKQLRRHAHKIIDGHNREAKQAPAPWYSVGGPTSTIDIFDADGKWLMALGNFDTAAFVVQAANAHDALLAACKAAALVADVNGNTRLLIELRAAIALAERTKP